MYCATRSANLTQGNVTPKACSRSIKSIGNAPDTSTTCITHINKSGKKVYDYCIKNKLDMQP